jgi:hypothetical protein
VSEKWFPLGTKAMRGDIGSSAQKVTKVGQSSLLCENPCEKNFPKYAKISQNREKPAKAKSSDFK